MKSKKIKWKFGDIFSIPLENGKYCVGQILGQNLPNTISISIYDEIIDRINNISILELCNSKKIISIIEITNENLNSGLWTIIGNKEIEVSKNDFPNEKFRKNGWIGAKTYGAGLAQIFVNAYYALLSWDSFHDPNYLDSFLIEPQKKPKNLIYKKNNYR